MGMAVIHSCVAAIVLACLCSGGTINNRPAFPVQTSQIQPPSNNKSPGRRIMHPAFENAGRAPGLEIWRIENFEPIVYPKNNHGKFYSGDSFIVLKTVEARDKKLSWDVHFWLGSETSLDEAGAAAILTVQLDDLLNGAPVQHREVQDHESQLFLSYFKNGVRYENGGVGSGFKHVQTNDQGDKRLFQVKGKRNIRVRQVNLSVSSMNKGDCFILDAGNEIHVYVGAQAKRVEKLKAISAANQIRDQDHNGRARVFIIDEFSTDGDKMKFFSIMGSGSPDKVPEESVDEEDGAFEANDANRVTLYKVKETNGKTNIDTISTKPLRQEMLDTNDCFILDTGSGIFVWVGKRASPKEKSESMAKAQQFLQTKKYPAWTQIHRIVDGAESAPFKQYFATWKDVGMSHTRLIRSALGYSTDDSELDSDDVDSMVQIFKKGGKAVGFMPDNGQKDIKEVTQYVTRSGTNQVLRKTVPFEENLPLLGFASYIIVYNFDAGPIIYVWEGSKATIDAKERSFEDALVMAVQQNAIVVRITQSHENRHFYKIFKGKLMTSYTKAPISPQLFRVRGFDSTDVHIHEVKADSSSLASNDVFALVNVESHKIYVWVGLGASKFEKNAALQRFDGFWDDAEVDIIEEGAEPDDFWEHLNGEGIYNRSLVEDSAPILDPRLFHCRLVGSRIRVEEVNEFEQSDLDVDDVMLLDAGDEIYMWVGDGATAEENGRILNMAKRYIAKEPTERTIDTVSIIRIKQGQEPKVFKRMFPSWDDDYWQSVPSYDDVKKQILEWNKRIGDNIV